MEIVAASLTVTAKGQVTLRRDLLQHLGIKPGERVSLEKLPGGELRVRAARTPGTVDDFLHSLDGKVKLKNPLSNEEINRIAVRTRRTCPGVGLTRLDWLSEGSAARNW